MNTTDLPSFDPNSPESVVDAFIRAMNVWETYANQVCRQLKADAWPEIHRSQKIVFDAFCTPKDRKFGRNGSFQRPPEYDPDSERIVGLDLVMEEKAHVGTVRKATLGGGRYQYVLLRPNDRWFIDSVMFFNGTQWEESLL